MRLLWMKCPHSQPALWRAQNCNTQTERGREKVDMREIREWSLGCHPRCSYMCQSFASEHRNKSELPPRPIHPPFQLPLSAVEGDAMKRTHFSCRVLRTSSHICFISAQTCMWNRSLTCLYQHASIFMPPPPIKCRANLTATLKHIVFDIKTTLPFCVANLWLLLMNLLFAL